MNTTKLLAENLTVYAGQKHNMLRLEYLNEKQDINLYETELFEDSLSGVEHFQDVELFGDWYVLKLYSNGVTEKTWGYLQPFSDANEGNEENIFAIKEFTIIYANVEEY